MFEKDNISLPGNAAVVGNDFLEPSAFPDAKYCGHCHQQAYHEWRESLHSNSFRTPFYRTSVNILLRTKGFEFARHCDSCHNPVGILAGALDKNSTVDRSFDRDGLTCMTCHSIQSVRPINGNGSFVMAVPAVMVDEQGNRIPGKATDAEIYAHTDRHSKAVMQDIYHSPEMCSACHKANLPSLLNNYKFIRAFTAYDEWQNSKFSQRNPLTFYQADFKSCQGCHMLRNTITLPDPGAKHGTIASHRWLAGNTAVPYYYGFDEQLAKTVEFLKSGNYLNIDLFALREARSETPIEPLGSSPITVKADQDYDAYVVIQNKISATRWCRKYAISMKPGSHSRLRMRRAQCFIKVAFSILISLSTSVHTASPTGLSTTVETLSTITWFGPSTPSPTITRYRLAAAHWCATISTCRQV